MVFKKGHKINVGRIKSSEVRKNMSIGQVGRIFTDDHRQKLSLAKKGKKMIWSEERKRLFKKQMRGNTHTLGRKCTQEEIKRRQLSLPKGEEHYRWIKDRTKLKDDSRDRGGQLHREWSKQVKNRDNWKCKFNNDDCQEGLVAHHILSWSKYPELRYEVNNGITLCHFHHPRKRNDEERLIPTFQKLVLTKVK